MPLSEAFQKLAKRVFLRIFLPGIEESVYEELKSILDKNQGNCPVFFQLETPHSFRLTLRSVDIQGVSPSEKLTKNIESLLGEESVFVEY